MVVSNYSILYLKYWPLSVKIYDGFGVTKS